MELAEARFDFPLIPISLDTDLKHFLRQLEDSFEEYQRHVVHPETQGTDGTPVQSIVRRFEVTAVNATNYTAKLFDEAGAVIANAITIYPIQKGVNDLTGNVSPDLGVGDDGSCIKDINGTFYTTFPVQDGLAGGGLDNVVEDATPQLGGTLDCLNENVTNVGDITIDGTSTAGELRSDSWKSNDASMTIDYTTVAAGSLVLDGDGDYVTTPYAGIAANGARTTLCWVKTSTAATRILTYGSAAAYWRLNVSGGGVARIATEDASINAATSIIDNAWHLVAATYAGGAANLEIWVDTGAAEASAAVNLSTGSDEDVVIGTDFPAADYFNGQISDVMFFNDDLNQAEIEEIHALGQNPTVAEMQGTDAYGDLVSWWRFVADATDAEGGNDGTFVDNAYVNATSVEGLTISEPTLIDDPLTITGALNVGGTGRIVGVLAVTEIQSTGDLILNPLSGSNLKSADLDTSGAGANVYYSSSVDTFYRSTSSPHRKIIISNMTVEEARVVLDLTPIKFYSKCKADNPDKVFYGLSAVDVAEKYPEATFYDANDTPDGWDINMMIAGLIKNQQELTVQNADLTERVEMLEAV